MPVMFRRSDVNEVVEPEMFAVVYPKPSRGRKPRGVTGLVFEDPQQSEDQPPERIVLDSAPALGGAICVSTQIYDLKEYGNSIAYVRVAVAFILSCLDGRVQHHVTVMQNVVGPKRSLLRTHVAGAPNAQAAEFLESRLARAEKKLHRINMNGMDLPQVMRKVRSCAWYYNDGCGGKEAAPYSVKVTYLN